MCNPEALFGLEIAAERLMAERKLQGHLLSIKSFKKNAILQDEKYNIYLIVVFIYLCQRLQPEKGGR